MVPYQYNYVRLDLARLAERSFNLQHLPNLEQLAMLRLQLAKGTEAPESSMSYKYLA